MASDLGINILGPETAFVALWLAVLALFRGARRNWRKWLNDPAHNPDAALDKERREMLKRVFEKYDDQRMLRYRQSLTADVDGFAIDMQSNDLPFLRREMARFFQDFEERMQENLPELVSNAQAATGERLFGPELGRLEQSGRVAARLRTTKRTGNFVAVATIACMVTSIASGILFALVEATFDVPAASAGVTLLDKSMLWLAWLALIGVVAGTLSLFELGQRDPAPAPVALPKS